MPESVDATQPALDEFSGLRISRETQRYDAICDQVIAMNDLVKQLVEKIPQGQTQTVIHKTQGMGTVGVICATVCVMCVVILILGAIIFVPDIHDLRAWQSTFGRDLAAIKAVQQQQKENGK